MTERRPPVDYTSDFLENLLQSNGADYFVKFFGPAGANKLAALGGTKDVAIAFTGNFSELLTVAYLLCTVTVCNVSVLCKCSVPIAN